ncbi:hypothetical protein CHLNCDRAFT_133994 [Chlorella variabilis]|uniref:Uncharacterized protein n=1 Tax=Chlorella variabilis TaxID=554065 RepID=E1ZER3_CHLVA|nr:hypothetical protein CHLNCDRAFT_133994 [Chlorella variabilis]EFN55544.1 hypothetical protein CHLNCDRAFT_133994 [Chlorella variabilis]|eukprot:XP_005847646.1 hypothetical protein CHLNCDRAFT_133994 [Chlorella variabilis]
MALGVARAGRQALGPAAPTQQPQPRQLHVLTVVTDAGSEHLQRLTRVAGRFGHRVDVAVPSGPVSYNAGFGLKLEATHRYLASLAAAEDLVLFVDGYDAVVAGTAAQIVGRAYLGPAGLLRDLIAANLDFSDPSFVKTDDQHFFHTLLWGNPAAIQLDYRCQLFTAAFTRADDLVCTPRGWLNNQTQTYPLVVHHNGHPKPKLERMLASLEQAGSDMRLVCPADETVAAAAADKPP